MLFWAGWLPTVATSGWQVEHRSWKSLLFSDLLSSGVLIAAALTLYIPIFLFNVAWFIPFALLPRGCATELLMRGIKIR